MTIRRFHNRIVLRGGEHVDELTEQPDGEWVLYADVQAALAETCNWPNGNCCLLAGRDSPTQHPKDTP